MTNGGEASGAVLDELGAAHLPLATEVPDWEGVPLDGPDVPDRRALSRLLPSGRQPDCGFNSSI